MKKLTCITVALTLLTLFSCTSQAQKPESPKSAGAAKLENRFSGEVVTNHNPELLAEILGDDFVSHQFPTPGNNNKAAFTEGMKNLFAGFPDIRVTRIEQHEIGDKAYTYAFWEGTQTGTFMGIPPSGKKVHVEYMDIWRVSDGKIRENWVVMDIAGLLIQLGVMPPPGGGK
ncbi:MAG: ester cyclase [Saprospiraceae bacterium]